jgi:hypothetical protein
MSLTTVPVSLVAFRSANTSANTLNGANVVFMGNTAYSTGMGLYQRRAGLQRGSFVQYEPPPPPYAQGSTDGYNMGGITGASVLQNRLDSFSFASGTTSSVTTSGLFQLYYIGAQSTASRTDGYMAGGTYYPGFTMYSTITKFPFSSGTPVLGIGNMTSARTGVVGSQSSTHGYALTGSTDVGTGGRTSTVDKYPFSSDTNATDIAESANEEAWYAQGSNSNENFYVTGYSGRDRKSSFASDTTWTLINPSGPSLYLGTGHSSETDGYISSANGGTSNRSKFPFSSDVVRTTVSGGTTEARTYVAGANSTTDGFVMGGGSGTGSTTIDKYPHASDTNAIDVGELVVGVYGSSGTQV